MDLGIEQRAALLESGEGIKWDLLCVATGSSARRLAGLDTPIPYAPHLEKTVVPQVEDIVRVAKELVA